MTPQKTLPENETTAAPGPAQPAQPQATAAHQQAIAAEIVHDLFLVGLAAAAFFVKNPQSQARAGQIVGILQGLQIGTPPGN